MKRFIIAGLAGLIIFLGLIVWHSPDYQARHILRTYDFHPVGMPKHTSIVLDEITFDSFNEASKELGYNLQPYKGKKVEVLQYGLLERHMYENGNGESAIYAKFLLNDKHQLIGASLEVKGMMPGVISFSENKPNY
ncbi:MAG: DUF4830 domain-containing protein [Syntrophomonas sp.]|nr:DUF4830 domain-containing protein [Syntrophomonas sp.]